MGCSDGWALLRKFPVVCRQLGMQKQFGEHLAIAWDTKGKMTHKIINKELKLKFHKLSKVRDIKKRSRDSACGTETV